MKFNDFVAAQVRIARPTDQFDRVIDFYVNGLGLAEIERFKGHRGYEGVVIGLSSSDYHLEFTHHHDGPTRDNLLVFYIKDYEQIRNVAYRLYDMGYPEVAPENEYWKEKGVTIEDPDGWRVVLMNRTYE